MTEHPDVTLIYLVAATKNYQSLPSGDNRQEKNDEYDHHQLTTWPQKRPTIDTVPADFKKKSQQGNKEEHRPTEDRTQRGCSKKPCGRPNKGILPTDSGDR